MTALRDIRIVAPLGFVLLLLLPSAAIGVGALSFDYRFEALLLVSLLLVGCCAVAGFTAAELGLTAPVRGRHWVGGALITAVLVAFVVLEADFVEGCRPTPNWMLFTPFYVLISCPLQEIVCRAIPKLIADRLQMSGAKYVLFSSGAFSLMHAAYGDTLLLANTFFAGVVWSVAYLLTRNIWPLALSHAAVGLYAFSLGVA
jgi:membrane protease YdiL (CAAX protease family)